MDWLRRNWPDLLIGVALVAVIAMIVATLLSGGSLASLVRRDTPPAPLITTGPDAAAADTSAPGTTSGTTSGTTPDNAGDGAADASGAGTPDGYDVFVPGVPGRDDLAGTSDGGLQTDGASPDAATPADSSAAQAPLPAASETGGFRVAAGALDSRDAASATAQGYRDGGYEVTVEQQDDLYLLWVGPYATREDADAAAASIIAGGGDALVYSYSGEREGDGEDALTDNADTDDLTDTDLTGTDAAAADVPDTATGTAQEAVSEGVEPFVPNAGNGAPGEADDGAATLADAGTGAAPAGNAANVGQGQRYLQVGAFANDESADSLRAQLEGLDLSVSRSEDAGGLVRLYVGPFGNAQLAQTQNRLNAQGIDSFPVVR